MGLVGCGGGEVPPSPDAPGGVAGEYSVAVDELGSWAVQNEVAIITPDYLKLNVANPNGSVDILVEDDAIWNTYYIYDFQIEEWIVDTFEDESYKDSGWILPSAAPKAGVTGISTTLDQISLDNVGDYLLAFYSCTKVNSWDCHGGWQVEAFNVTKDTLEDISFTVDVSGTQDDSIIAIEAVSENEPYTNILLSLLSLDNKFNIVESSVPFNYTSEGGPVAFLELTQSNFQGEMIVLRGNWKEDGDFSMSVGGKGVGVEDRTQTTTVTGSVDLDLPEAPRGIGVEEEATLDEGLLLHYEFNENDQYDVVGDVVFNDGAAEFSRAKPLNYIDTNIAQDGNIRTISMWVNYKSLGTITDRYQISGNRNGPYLGFWGTMDKDHNFRWGDLSAHLKVLVEPDSGILDVGEWHMITMTATEQGDGLFTTYGYIDGELVNELYYNSDGSNTNLNMDGYSFWLGSTNNRGNGYGQMDASLDNVRFYDRPLTDEQVAELYTLENPENSQELFGVESFEPTCEDSDPQDSEYSPGTVTVQTEDGEIIEVADECDGGTHVIEYGCNGTELVSTQKPFLGATECSQGACEAAR